MAKVVIERCDSYSPGAVRGAVERALGAALGPDGDSVSEKRVLLKPNLLSAREPVRGVTTHPAIVGAVVDYFRDRGARVYIGDSPGGALRGIERVWERTGMLDVARARGATLVSFEAGGWVVRSVDGRPYAIAKAVGDFDRVVNLPKLKTHILTVLTGGIKNMFGCVPGFRKSSLHLAHPRPDAMSKVIVDVFSLVKPWVTLVDAVDAMEGNGPSSGRVRHLGIVAAGTDCVALDTVLARIVGIDPQRVPTTREACERGLGEGSIGKILLQGAKLDDVTVGGFEVPSNWKFFLIPGGLGRLLARLVWVKPDVRPEDCIGCGDCVSMCPAGAIRLHSGKAVIDQARCTSCLCCHEACVAGAVGVRISRLAKLIA
jgi:uncharacterized protein (DUF362 family)/Pyruvate/2-oxoacid:ferredoxin oxidoreductase delta subunit